MSFLLRGVFSNASTGASLNGRQTPLINENAAEIIERLCDRVQSSSLIEDRRDAVKSLKTLVTKHKLEVGTQAMPILIEILRNNRDDYDLCQLALSILYDIFTQTNSSSTNNVLNLPNDINIQFSEVFLKTKTNIELLIELLSEYDFNIRYGTLKLISCLINNCAREMQSSLLVCPMAITKIIDLLNETREVIRNDSIILLQHLSKHNINIQKIIAFENGFERIVDIIEMEMSSDGVRVDEGSVIIEDCLCLLIEILMHNQSNQILFKEGNYLKRLASLIDTKVSNEWSKQKINNLIHLFRLMRSLVTTSGQVQLISEYQRLFNQSGLLHKLCALLMIQDLSSNILGECIHTLGDLIRGNSTNQQFIGTIVVSQLQPTRPLLIVLLMSMINEKQTLKLRYSILYLIQCYLYRNLQAKLEIIETLVSPSSSTCDANLISTGQLLCSGLLNQNDQVSSWLCSCALSHCLLDNDKDKANLLKVQLAYDQLLGHGEPISLIQQLMNILIYHLNANKLIENVQRVLGYLMFMSNWLLNSPSSVEVFLSNASNLTFLISIICLNDTSECFVQIIQGVCSFLLGTCVLFNKGTHIRETIKRRIGLEHFELRLAYISQSELYTKSLKHSFVMPTSRHDLLYDYEFCKLFKQNETCIVSTLTKDDLQAQLNQDQLIILNDKLQKQTNDMNELKLKLSEQQELNEILVKTLRQLEDKHQQLRDQHSLMKLNNNNDLMTHKNHSHNNSIEEIEILRAQLKEEQLKSQKLNLQLALKDDELNLKRHDQSSLGTSQNELLKQKDDTIEKLKNDIAQLQSLKSENDKLNENLKDLNEEQDNLLVLLQEMEDKCRNYKNILKSYGYTELNDDELENEDDLK